MFTLVIVDDEDVVRNGLMTFVDWKALGFEVTACFDDGGETIEYLRQHDVDVVLTDIQMSNVSGLAVAEYIYEHKPQIKTVILSGYKDFGFAQKAIEYNVWHYLLKPAKLDRIMQVFEDIRRRLMIEHKQKAANLPEIQHVYDTYRRDGLQAKEYKQFIHHCKQMIPLVAEGKMDEFAAQLDRMLDELKGYPIQNAQRLLIEFHAMLTFHLVKLDMDACIENTGAHVYYSIMNMRNIEEIRTWCKDWVRNVVEPYGLDDRKVSSGQLVEKAKQYINENYQYNISLQSVSNHVYLSSVYLSRLFKEYTGMNFIDYLTQVRVEKAIELLGDKCNKTYEIGTKVGYSNSKYFSKVFKQYTGYAPKEYSRKFSGRRRSFL